MNLFGRKAKKNKFENIRTQNLGNTGRKKERKRLFGLEFSNIRGNPNKKLILLVAVLLLAGLAMNYSASFSLASESFDGDSFYYFKRQIMWIVFGAVLGGICYVMPVKFFRHLSILLLGGGILLLLYMLPEAVFGKTLELSTGEVVTSGLQMPFVVTKNGATRWLDFTLFDFQPTELVKIGFIMYLSAWLTRETKKKSKAISDVEFHYKYTFLPFLLILGLISVLIVLQRDFDTTVVIALSAMVVYYVSGNDRIHTIGSTLLFAFASVFGFIALNLEEYRRARLASFFNLFLTGEPNDPKFRDFQIWQSVSGIGRGEIWGEGFGESVAKQGFLQEAAYTDSIFVVIGEEFGFVGAVSVIIAFLYFASLGFEIARSAKDKFSSLLVIGLTSWIVIQAFFNIGANLAVIPFGGMPLPFFTYGGSGILSVLISVGIILNVSKKGE